MQQRTPIYIISSLDHGVPIPNNEFDFVVDTGRFDNFEVAKVRVGHEEISIEEAFVIGLTKQNSLMLGLIEDVDELASSIADVGVFCELISIEETTESDRIISCKVIAKALIKDIEKADTKYYADITLLSEVPPSPNSQSSLELRSIFHGLTNSVRGFPKRTKAKILQSDNILYISNLIVDSMCLNDDDKFNYLQSKDPLYNIAYSINLLLANLEHSQAQDDFESLFDQLKIKIKQESASKRRSDKSSSIRERISDLPMNDESKTKLLNEVDRLEKLPPSSMEFHTVKDYLSWIESIPWGSYSNKTPDLTSLVEILNETHYGLDEVKEHILEYLTIEAITKKSQGTVLCFLGNPGTGKTSIAKQIAKACNREIVKIAVGGMSDEAEIRGHRRTYVASRPGRIVSGLKSAKTMDPLILFDEVDKIDGATRGDPTSALLELFDPEQNSEFIDRYLEVPVDLSKALFIATANYIDKIPAPLRDRMEIISFRDYSVEEKKIILLDFVIPKAIKEYQIDNFDITIEDEVIDTLADKYRIREIKRKLYKLLRKAAVQIFVENKESVIINLEFLNSIEQNDTSKKNIGFD